MPQTPDHLMKETLYMKIIHLLDRHRTWLEIESIATVRNHTIVRNGRMTDILSRVLVVKAIHHHFPYTRGQVWQIAEYDMEQAIKSLRTTDGAFRQRIIKGELTLEDVERIISTATHGVVQPDLSPLPLFKCSNSYDWEDTVFHPDVGVLLCADDSAQKPQTVYDTVLSAHDRACGSKETLPADAAHPAVRVPLPLPLCTL